MGQVLSFAALVLLLVAFGIWKVALLSIGLAVLLFAVVIGFAYLTSPPGQAKYKNSRMQAMKDRVPKDMTAVEGCSNHIRTGLVIDEPWISKITNGEKVWEMRSRATKKRERIALIKKGSSSVVGMATIVDVLGPFSDSQIVETFARHRVPLQMIGKWRFAWVLGDVAKLDRPITYQHNSGAVTWVTLDPVASQEVSAADAASA